MSPAGTGDPRRDDAGATLVLALRTYASITARHTFGASRTAIAIRGLRALVLGPGLLFGGFFYGNVVGAVDALVVAGGGRPGTVDDACSRALDRAWDALRELARRTGRRA